MKRRAKYKRIIIKIFSLLACAHEYFRNVTGVVGKARVPGGVFADLRASGVLKEDPMRRYNDVMYRWVSEDDWTYTTTFNGD